MIIFSPGPANISDRVRNALTLPDICHRDVEFSELFQETRMLLTEALHVDSEHHEIVLLSGSGTLAIESLITSLAGWDKTLLIIANGIYGERANEIATIYGVKTRELRLDWGESPDLNVIEDEIKKPEIGGVHLIHHETTTGLLNPLKETALLAKKHDKLVLSDTISSVVGEHLDLGWGLDAILGTANKCFRGVPAVAFAVVSKDLINIIRKRQRRSYYSDLMTHLDRGTKMETPFTPPVHSLFAFREAIRETLEEGIENRIAHYQRISGLLRAGLKNMGLRLLLPEERYSNTMTSVRLPSGVSFKELHDKIKEKGFVIYNAQGHLRGKLFMLGVVGVISEQNIRDFLVVLRDALEDRV